MKLSQKGTGKVVFATIIFMCLATISFGQYDAKKLVDGILTNPEYQKDWVEIKEMRFNNIGDQQIIDFLEEQYAKQRKDAAVKKGEGGDPLPSNFSYNDLYLMSSCNTNDIGAELGSFATWKGQTSLWGGFSCTATPWSNVTLPAAGRITIVPSPATDPCATISGFPIPLPSPTGGKYSIKLGNNGTGGQSERITHQFIVQPQDTNFIYQYAVVFQDPGHIPSQQPFFDFVIIAQNGDTVACSFQHYVAGAGIPGFQTVSSTLAACATGTSGGQVKYKPWSTVGVNLGKYLGQQVSIVCTVGDCAQCGHFGYAYLDFSCGTTTASQFCTGSTSVTVTAPLEPGATYSWVPGGQTTSSVIVNPQVTDTVAVFVTPPAGCGYYVKYILEPTVISPAFTYTTACNTANFTNGTTITGGTITSYSWSFPGGSPSSSTLEHPPAITYPLTGGTYTATLTVVSLAGCTVAPISHVFTVSVPVTSAGADVTLCGGNTAVLNGSGNPAGGIYSWSPPTNLSNPAISNPTAGPFSSPATYTLTYTNPVDGCKGTDVVNVMIGSEPVADASYSLTLTCEGAVVTFKDSSQNATAWNWDFGDGSTSTLQHPPAHSYNWNATYSVTLIASNGNCRDTLVTVLPIGDINAFVTVKNPNVFTPNGDNLNDCFQPILTGPTVAEIEKCMTMEVYDRWGIKIFESTGGTTVCWDGKTKSNTKAKDGTYYYLMEMGGNTYKGYVTLLREKK